MAVESRRQLNTCLISERRQAASISRELAKSEGSDAVIEIVRRIKDPQARKASDLHCLRLMTCSDNFELPIEVVQPEVVEMLAALTLSSVREESEEAIWIVINLFCDNDFVQLDTRALISALVNIAQEGKIAALTEMALHGLVNAAGTSQGATFVLELTDFNRLLQIVEVETGLNGHFFRLVTKIVTHHPDPQLEKVS